MKDSLNEQLAFEETKERLSHRLLKAYVYKNNPLECQFICLTCHGISINPLFCKLCKYSYCERCFDSTPDSKVSCLCKKSCKANFSKDLNHELYKSYYLIKDNSAPNNPKQITYNEALSLEYKSACRFISFEETKNPSGKYQEDKILVTETEKLIKNKGKFAHQFFKKYARMINFHQFKGYKLYSDKKKLGEKYFTFMRVVHLKTIIFYNCIWNIEFALRFYQAMIFNRKRITTCTIDSFCNKDINLKLYLIIYNALSVCTNLREIYLLLPEQKYRDFLFPKSFYNFLSKFLLLKKIGFWHLCFYDYMNFEPFQSLQFLENLTFYFCRFHINCFEELYNNNFPNLKRLELNGNRISNFLSDQNGSKSQSILKSNMKIPTILRITFGYESYLFEKSIFQKLILCQKMSMKYLYLDFLRGGNFNSEKILCFINFLKNSKIQFLSLNNLFKTEGFDSPDFLEFLRNSTSLLGLSLRFSEMDFKLNLILQELSLNKTIQILYLDNVRLINFLSNLVNLINSNKTISILVLCGTIIGKWKIDVSFIDAVLNSQTLLYLIPCDADIEDDLVLKLAKSNLKGINVDHLELSQSTKNLIYKKIPRIDYDPHFDDLLYYEKFLRPTK